MGSQDSNVNSEGFPIDHDGAVLEMVGEGGFSTPLGGSGAGGFARGDNPLLVSGDVFKEIMSGKSSKLVGMKIPESEMFGCNVMASSSGGIKIANTEDVLVEDVLDYSSEEIEISRDEEEAMASATTNPAVKMAFAINKQEREELFSTRKQLHEVSSFLKKRGFNFDEVLMESRRNLGYSSPSLNRDEFGLPKFSDLKHREMPGGSEQLVDKSKVHSDEVDVEKPDVCKDKLKQKVSEEFPPLPNMKACSDSKERAEPQVKPLWSKVVKEPPQPVNNVCFDYCPRPVGISVVSPPVEVLQEGNAKFKNCLVGTFSKGTKPYNTVVGVACKAWEKRGLLNVYQKDSNVFIFKFDSELAMNKILALGTWYVEGQPMLLKAWGRPLTAKAETMPLWVKFSKIPDCYWTQKGLSWLGSAVGRPLCADALTSKLEILPFAKICVEYKIGDDLPEAIEVQDLDPVSGELVISKVLVHYPLKPLVCTGCHELGHKVGACPSTKRIWVVKEKHDTLKQGVQGVQGAQGGPSNEDANTGNKTTPMSAPSMEYSLLDKNLKSEANVATPGIVPGKVLGCVSAQNVDGEDSPSPSPLATFKGLKNVDEIDSKRAAAVTGFAKLTKSQKRRRKSQGSPPNLFHS
ncbi:hypothetical protein POM88_054163 [Heracleum sosnowskyi]|uniref:DUF4283 domain-containing protein n=1 Tax=Heracleum sosnowskyi TaxID=360622 RepID=A0AAD8LXA0_9APIA|nr:hypothetical protein POM88_054163 [Heracleum sosnowskyi]